MASLCRERDIIFTSDTYFYLAACYAWKVTSRCTRSRCSLLPRFFLHAGWIEWNGSGEGKEGREEGEEGVNKMGERREGEKKGGIEINGMKTSIPLQLATSLRVVAACNGIKTD